MTNRVINSSHFLLDDNTNFGLENKDLNGLIFFS